MEPESVLIVKPGSFGDVIHALPCAAALRKNWPQTRITWLVDDRWQDLLKGNPHVDQTVVFPRRQFHGLDGKLRSLPWAFSLRALRPALALDLQGLLRSALMARLSGAKCTMGLADAREGACWFYDKTAPFVSGEHSVRRYLRILETLGLPPVENPEFPLPPGSRPAEAPSEKSFILLHPLARGKGKSLSDEHILRLCAALDPVRVVIAGMGRVQAALPANALNLLNRTSIGEMIWLIRAASFVVSVDSGPMHIAAAVGSELLSIHTWSDPRLVGPFNEKAWIWQGGEIRRQQLAPVSIPKPRPLTLADIEAMAAHIKDRLKIRAI